MQAIDSNAKGVLFVVSTSHMDWHWQVTFEQYYTMGSGTDYPVRYILDAVKALMPDLTKPLQAGEAKQPFYQYNLAEVAWLRRYLLDNPDWLAKLQQLKGFFSLIGGGITSPDSLVTNGEVFIRNYLVGRNYVRSRGLGELLTNVCWAPDDFGSDPQLPVVLKAMGFSGVGFGRIPGWQQPQGGLPYSGYYVPQDGGLSLSQELATNGMTFYWAAADNSTVLANFMFQYNRVNGTISVQNPAYGFPWTQAEAAPSVFNEYITGNMYPQPVVQRPVSTFPIEQTGLIMMTPTGGDFSVPEIGLSTAVKQYNEEYYNPSGSNYNASGVYAILGTFEEFVQYMIKQSVAQPFPIPSRQGWEASQQGFDPSSYWTGHFANYVQIKITQQRSTNRLLAAETLSTLLRAYTYVSWNTLDNIDQMIAVAWNNLVPSSHHDYITGTAPTAIYRQEQIPLINLAQDQAKEALRHAMQLLAISVKPDQPGIPYVVFNPAGTERTMGNIIELPADAKLSSALSYSIAGNNSAFYPIQRNANGTLLIQVPGLASTGYTLVYFSTAPSNQTINIPATPPPPAGSIYLSNGTVQIAINTTSPGGWSLSSIQEVKTGREFVNGACNVIQVYDEGSYGNPYQMGNEYAAAEGDKSTNAGFSLATNASYTSGKGKLIESGPYRWRYAGQMENSQGSSSQSTLEVEYTLLLQEPLVRVRVTGNAAPNVATSVVSNWSVKGAASTPPAMSYGTANHWNGPDYTAYWPGPVFRSTHDFVTVNDPKAPSGKPLAAMYHEGMRAWAYDNGQLMGILFRNTNNNGGRGASNSDSDTHTQHYAFRIDGPGNPENGLPLQESMQFQQALEVAPVPSPNAYLAVMPASGYLASISGNAFIRMARTQSGSGGAPTIQKTGTAPLPFSCVLRIYQPGNNPKGNWTLTVPFLENNSGGEAKLSFVTALEEEIANAAIPVASGDTVTFASMDTLTTLRIQSYGQNVAAS